MMSAAANPKSTPDTSPPRWIKPTLTLFSSFGAVIGALMMAFLWGSVGGWVGVVILGLAIVAWARTFACRGRWTGADRPGGVMVCGSP